MQQYQDSVLTQNASGITVVGAGLTVHVYNAGTVVPATVYSDNGITVIDQLLAPITTDINGKFEFYAANGRYDVTITGATITSITVPDILLEDLTLFFGGNYADNLGTVNALAASYPNAVTSVLSDGYPIEVDTSVLGTNTGAVTITPTLRGVVQATAAVLKYNGVRALVPVVAGDMPTVAQLRYNMSSLLWVLINPVAGEVIIATVAVGSVALTSGVVATVTSVALPVGDWDVTGLLTTSPAATTSLTAVASAINTAAALPAAGTYVADYRTAYVPGAVAITRACQTARLKLTVPTTVYLLASVQFTVSTATAGGTITARRAAQ